MEKFMVRYLYGGGGTVRDLALPPRILGVQIPAPPPLQASPRKVIHN